MDRTKHSATWSDGLVLQSSGGGEIIREVRIAITRLMFVYVTCCCVPFRDVPSVVLRILRSTEIAPCKKHSVRDWQAHL